ncbi:hypothetical protein PybrP1_012633 [[Pythium] brassicae (nom. inval.)]|nr:hypothetical protein PybrP1_012633 [[Pythium] brassicae (nom. inval.)]
MHLYFGQDPALGVSDVLGTNDAPFTDRAYVCSLRDRLYRPVQLQQALDAPTSIVLDAADGAVNGYRMVKRTGLRLDGPAMAAYQHKCSAIASTKNEIIDWCRTLGYDVTQDALRIIEDDGVRSMMKLIPDTLPIVAIPYADNLPFSRYALPGRDGSACMLRLDGAYASDKSTQMLLIGVNRTVRERKTAELLGRPGGVWRNGWYEDGEGERWFSDIINSDSMSFGIPTRQFDVTAHTERDCTASSPCGASSRVVSWGPKLVATDDIHRFTSLAVMNSAHRGVFLFDALVQRYVESVYDLETTLANFSLGVLLARWAVCMVALVNGYRSGAMCELQSAGIGVLSCTHNFHLLPFFLLPKLKMTLAVFATIGCTFDGSQLALSQAWFVMYPSIAELLFFAYSLLNLLAKLLRRRASDTLFGPTLLFFCAMHYFRTDLAQSRWFEYDGRMETLVTSERLQQLSVLDFFRDRTLLLQLNGNVKSLFLIKVAVLAMNLLPLVFSRSVTADARAGTATLTEAETALALYLAADGGIGASRPTSILTIRSKRAAPALVSGPDATALLSGYELLRFGYVVVGDTWLVKISDWFLLVSMAAARLQRASTLRLMMFEIKKDPARALYSVCRKPVLCQISDPRILAHNVWTPSTRPLR